METSADAVALDLEALRQLAVALLCGGAIGLEREARGRAAGLRTMILVCLGATLVMIASGRLPAPHPEGAAQAVLRVDPGRIAAGIVTGIGFLGAGVVIKLGDLIRGVTTAASIWLVAALGIVIGHGYYRLALLATGLALVVLWLFAYLERWIPSPLYRRIQLVTVSSRSSRVLDAARQVLRGQRIRLLELHVLEDRDAGLSEIGLWIRTRNPLGAHAVVQEIASIEGVSKVEWRS